jgi:hypothetical protein
MVFLAPEQKREWLQRRYFLLHSGPKSWCGKHWACTYMYGCQSDLHVEQIVYPGESNLLI